jgi:hypothetical protein
MRERCLRLVVAAVVLALTATPAFADGVYHSQNIALVPAGDFLLRSGFVENIHANGPIVYAHENYVLNGAAPNTTFDVFLLVHPDPECAVQIMEIPTASVTTNRAGNGKAQAVFTPEQAPHDVTLFMRWELRSGGIVAYRTACSMVVLD